MHNIKKGLNLPIGGKPEQSISDGPDVKHVALLGCDYIGLRPSMAVEVGQKVKKGQLLFVDKKNPAARFTAPAAGVVKAVNRGERRVFQSLVIEVDPHGESVAFAKTPAARLEGLTAEAVIEELQLSGMWTALRTRPFDKVPAAGTLPHSLFVTAMDTNPLGVDAKTVIDAEAEAFVNGLKVLCRLGSFPVYLCKDERSLPSCSQPNLKEEVFIGPHPAGLPGTHIHYLDPVSDKKTVWYVGYQDVIAIGHLFTEGEYCARRVVAVGGPQAVRPRLVATVQGVSVAELLAGEIKPGVKDVRVITGSVLYGYHAVGPFAYLGRYQNQISLLAEGRQHEFFLKNWFGLGRTRHSATPTVLSAWLKPASYTFTTAINGGPRPILPIGAYERVMLPEFEATMLMRAIDINDVDQAKLLGILELGEEDVALCTYVCPGKNDFAPLLRRSLTKIELEG